MPKKPSKKPAPETKPSAPAPKLPMEIPGLPPSRFTPPASALPGPSKAKGKPNLAGPRPGAKFSQESQAKNRPGSMPEVRHDLSKRQVDAIREFALALAGNTIDPDAIMLCNPVSEPAALPLSELLYDRCRWCNVEIYYDRLMPAPLGLMRVCIACGVMLLEAEKKGGN